MKKNLVFTIVFSLIIVLCSLSVVSLFAFNYIGTIEIAGVSMEPSYTTGDRCMINKVEYKDKQPKRFDIVIYEAPDNGIRYIHRIIGLPNEELEIKDGSVYINGNLLNEPYLKDGTRTEWKEKKPFGSKIYLGDDEYYVLGDNREFAKDSRTFGAITSEDIEGKVMNLCW